MSKYLFSFMQSQTQILENGTEVFLGGMSKYWFSSVLREPLQGLFWYVYIYIYLYVEGSLQGDLRDAQTLGWYVHGSNIIDTEVPLHNGGGKY